MKKRFFPAMLLAATLGVIGCSDKDIVDVGGNGTEDSGKYAYINTAISFPSSGYTRSATDNYPDTGTGNTNSNENTDYENAYDYESDVRSMILVIANKDDEYLTHSVVPTITPTQLYNNPAYTANSKIPYDVLEKAYKTGGILASSKDEEGNIVVNLYAYCNYTSDILNSFEQYAVDLKEGKSGVTTTDWLDWYGTVEEAPAAAGKAKPTITNTIWASRSFLMTNYTNYQTDKFPNDINDWEAYSNQSNPLDLTLEDNTKKRTPLKVERAAARIDFKDGSLDADGNANDNTYPLITYVREVTETETDGSKQKQEVINEKNYFSVQLTRMALVNMSKNFYYLRRVSDDGMPKSESNNWEVGGYEYYNETNGAHNYVVDVDAADKREKEGIVPGGVDANKPENAGNHFNFRLYSDTKTSNGKYSYNKGAWYADNIIDVLNGQNDQWKAEPYQGGYHIWRYVTENTIPQSEDAEHPESQQKTVQSTGIVFKGAIIAGDDLNDSEDFSKKVKEALAAAAEHKKDFDYPILYSFNNFLYAGIQELIEEAFKDGENGPLYQAVNNVLVKNWTLADGKYTFKKGLGNVDDEDALTVTRCFGILHQDDEKYPEFEETYKGLSVDLTSNKTEEEFCKLVPAEKITVYEATDEGVEDESDGAGMGYYCYYFYWNRHNDNLKSGKMGPMEFATVRNNVYKLSVSKISQLGHPRDTDHDPDPVDPEDPDEDPTNYIKVDVEVLPWVVRVNDIEF